MRSTIKSKFSLLVAQTLAIDSGPASSRMCSTSCSGSPRRARNAMAERAHHVARDGMIQSHATHVPAKVTFNNTMQMIQREVYTAPQRLISPRIVKVWRWRRLGGRMMDSRGPSPVHFCIHRQNVWKPHSKSKMYGVPIVSHERGAKATRFSILILQFSNLPPIHDSG